MFRKWPVILSAIAALIAGFIVGYSLHATTKAKEAKLQEAYPLLAKRIFQENPNDTLVNFTSLRSSIRQQFRDQQQPYSFYFEYLPTGTSIRSEGENKLVAASLVKLPLVMNLYHTAELNRVKLDDSITLRAEDLSPAFGDLYQKGPGTKITLREAAKLALTQSDNTAARAINHAITGKLGTNEDSLPWLDIDYDIEGEEAIVSARAYSSILKCLYFACYLSTDSSQEILSYLTQSSFSDRLTKYTPKDLKVAHKIGVFKPTDVHSDCGLFYVPQRPYVLCIMMEGDEAGVSEAIAKLSKEVYTRVTAGQQP